MTPRGCTSILRVFRLRSWPWLRATVGRCQFGATAVSPSTTPLAACSITSATASGWVRNTTWLPLTSVVTAPIRSAVLRSNSGAIAPSSVATTYQARLGLPCRRRHLGLKRPHSDRHLGVAQECGVGIVGVPSKAVLERLRLQEREAVGLHVGLKVRRRGTSAYWSSVDCPTSGAKAAT